MFEKQEMKCGLQRVLRSDGVAFVTLLTMLDS